MRNPESFDAYYVGTRARFLHEAYALTGDAPASRGALRDAYVVAWHHWRKVSLLDDPDAYIRGIAHGRARRRHTARIWHRDKTLDPGIKATFDALSKLSASQRQLLVLTGLSTLSMHDIARTVGLPRGDAERELQTATSQFALHRDVATTDIRGLLEDLAAPLETVRWPRVTVIRRTGAARRRTHTVVGAAMATAALVVSGSLVAGGSGAEATSLSTEKATSGITVHAPSEATTGEAVIDEESLLTDDQVTRVGAKLAWAETGTTDNLSGDGLIAPCQRERFADPEGVAALARTWEGSETTVKRTTVRRNGKERVRKKKVTSVSSTVLQMVEMSSGEEQAAQGFETASLWFAACMDPRTQLMSSRTVKGVGESARQFRLRTWGKVPSSVSVGMARSGSLVVTTLVRSQAGPVPDKAVATTLAAAVNRLCGSPGAGACAGRARGHSTDPLAIGDPPGLLMAVDLPPVAAARGPWTGTDPERARTNYAATRCDGTTFQSKGIRKPLTRTFVFLETPNADQLGLTQTVGLMREKAAKRFVEVVRTRLRQCGAANLGTEVTPLAAMSRKSQELQVWALSIELNDQQSFPFFMAIVRDGNAVSQVGFTPDRKMTMSRADFVGVARRSLERLSDLPGAKR
jgi:DNA-directed RNA polymerase specialized sigma24 family protein